MNGLGVLYFSKQCKPSTTLINVMGNQGLLQMFKQICVDEFELDELIKRGIEETPTLIIYPNGQQSQALYKGIHAFNWVDMIISNRRNAMIQRAEQTRKLIQINQMKKRVKDGLYEYCPSEATGISDNYSFWKNDITQDVDIPLPKSFMPCNQYENHSIITVQERSDGKITKLNPQDHDKLSKELLKQREQQDSNIQKTYENQQIDNVLNSLNNI